MLSVYSWPSQVWWTQVNWKWVNFTSHLIPFKGQTKKKTDSKLYTLGMTSLSVNDEIEMDICISKDSIEEAIFISKMMRMLMKAMCLTHFYLCFTVSCTWDCAADRLVSRWNAMMLVAYLSWSNFRITELQRIMDAEM